ncbi:MAG: ADP/ATP-dependent (S)-NAD(P)H-hydrate dehydratase [Candidatus Roizmanbacteria bacterium]|nr:ADP/ATP-dependent (S)-NAD(P)H-hydrate dehydratase [Candidatus Roizmanbacteria bacterium]
MIIPQGKLMEYVKEDDAVLVGSGMMREGEEAKYTFDLTKLLIKNFPDKQFVFDAGSLQMMKPEWLLNLKKPAVITPHQKEFEKLFSQPILNLTVEEKTKIVKETAKKYQTIILLKAVVDIISDGKETYVVEGGNAGLTKGGTGDVLAGLTTALSATNPVLISAVSASILLKKTGEKLFLSKGYWYNIDNIIELIPEVLKESIDI